MGQVYRGKTEDAGAPILGSKFWKKGVAITGKVVRSFETANGTCYEIELIKPLKLDMSLTAQGGDSTETVKRIAVGALKGFGMALAAAGLEELESGDGVHLECTGSSKTGKGNPRVDFIIEVTR